MEKQSGQTVAIFHFSSQVSRCEDVADGVSVSEQDGPCSYYWSTASAHKTLCPETKAKVSNPAC